MTREQVEMKSTASTVPTLLEMINETKLASIIQKLLKKKATLTPSKTYVVRLLLNSNLNLRSSKCLLSLYTLSSLSVLEKGPG